MSIERGLTFLKFGWMPLLLVACSGNTSVGDDVMMTDNATLAVALNQRVFPSESTTPAGSACNTYLLKRGTPNAASGRRPRHRPAARGEPDGGRLLSRRERH